MSAQPPLNHQSPCSSSFLLVVEGLSVTTLCPPLAPLYGNCMLGKGAQAGRRGHGLCKVPEP